MKQFAYRAVCLKSSFLREQFATYAHGKTVEYILPRNPEHKTFSDYCVLTRSCIADKSLSPVYICVPALCHSFHLMISFPSLIMCQRSFCITEVHPENID